MKEFKEHYLKKVANIDTNRIDVVEDSDSDDYILHIMKEKTIMHYNTLYDRVLKTWKDINADAEFEKMRNIRDKIMSHNEIKSFEGKRRLFALSDIKVNWKDSIRLFESILKMTVDIYGFVFRSYYKLDNIINMQGNWAKALSQYLLKG